MKFQNKSRSRGGGLLVNYVGMLLGLEANNKKQDDDRHLQRCFLQMRNIYTHEPEFPDGFVFTAE